MFNFDDDSKIFANIVKLIYSEPNINESPT